MRKASTKAIVYGVLLLAAGFFLLHSMKGTPAPPTAKPPRVATAGVVRPASATGDERPVQAAPENAALDRYQVIVTRNIFAPPAPPRPKQTARERGGLPPLVIRPEHLKPSEPKDPEPQSLEGWQFVGYYSLNGEMRGVVQNDNNETAKELTVGEQWMGYRVESVSARDHGEMVLVCGRTRVSLKPPTDYSVVALSGMTAQPARPGQQPGMGPGGQPGMGPGRMGMGPGMGMRGGGPGPGPGRGG